jgi:hypothetical protein
MRRRRRDKQVKQVNQPRLSFTVPFYPFQGHPICTSE